MITAPTDDAALSADAVEIRGLAWAGENRVERVELSTDGGDIWTDTDLGESTLGRYAWRRFRIEWTPEAGEHRLLTRATDAKGRVHPARIAAPDSEQTGIEDESYPWTKGYGNNAYRPLGISVTVESGDA